MKRIYITLGLKKNQIFFSMVKNETDKFIIIKPYSLFK